MSTISPIESEFATTEDAEAHNQWFRAKVEAALASDAPAIPHDQVMAEVKGILEARRGATSRLTRWRLGIR